MPPDDILTQEQINELIETFKKSNDQVYKDLISATAATDVELASFIKDYKKEQQNHGKELDKILKSTEGVN